MSLLAKFADIAAARSALGSADPSKVVIDEIVSPTEAIIGGRHTVLAGTNNYLGLTFDPACIAAGQRALAESGTGTTGSRMANGNYSAHRALEQEIAAFYGYPYAMVFSTGYAANLGTLAALLGPEDAVLLDADAHASLYDGAAMTRAGIYRFKHNDPDSLDKRLTHKGKVDLCCTDQLILLWVRNLRSHALPRDSTRRRPLKRRVVPDTRWTWLPCRVPVRVRTWTDRCRRGGTIGAGSRGSAGASGRGTAPARRLR